MPRKLTILYGSQTGCAQDLAEQIYRESKIYHFTGPVCAMDEYPVQHLINEQFVVFVCSTTGQGDEPDNMRNFWKFLLRKSLASDSLIGMHYAVLGLGDSSYSKFNFVAKRLNRRLQQLGGRELLPIGLCDDQHDLGPSAVYMPWITNLWSKLINLCPMPIGYSKLSKVPNECKWFIKIIDEDKENNNRLKRESEDIYDYSNETSFEKQFFGKVLSIERTTSKDHFQDVRLFSFMPIKGSWSPGDVVQLRPKNSKENVTKLFDLFKEHNLSMFPETTVHVTELDPEMPVPKHLQSPLSLRTIATQLWDLNAIPRPRAFELLALNCDNELEKEKLIEFTTAEGQQDLFTYANRPRRTMLEVLEDFPHATSKLNLQIVFELFQPIRLRSFSIASCAESGKLDILVALVEYKTILHTSRKGLCSTWLKTLKVDDYVNGFLKKGTFKVPPLDIPLIMVGPGTGLAPFRSILQKKEQNWNEETFSTLFFGCRSEKGDFHCREDLEQMKRIGLLKLFTAFSRDQEDKIYVQHRIKEQKELLRDLIMSKQAVFMVAGNSKNMPRSVREAIVEVLDHDQDFVDQMFKTGQYQEETWA